MSDHVFAGSRADRDRERAAQFAESDESLCIFLGKPVSRREPRIDVVDCHDEPEAGWKRGNGLRECEQGIDGLCRDRRDRKAGSFEIRQYRSLDGRQEASLTWLRHHADHDDAGRLRKGSNLGQARMNLGVGADLEEGGCRGEQPALATAGASDDQAVVRTGLGRRKTLDSADDHVAHLVREQERL